MSAFPRTWPEFREYLKHAPQRRAEMDERDPKLRALEAEYIETRTGPPSTWPTFAEWSADELARETRDTEIEVGEEGGMTGGHWDTCDRQAFGTDDRILLCRQPYGHQGPHRDPGHFWRSPMSYETGDAA